MDDLIQLAQSVRTSAYAPYSGYTVGAAILSANGQQFVGVNFENLSYGAAICAERNAVGAMVAAGERKVAKLVVATEDGGSPCGICLQVLAEFGEPGLPIILVDGEGRAVTRRLDEFLPNAFASSHVKRVE